MTPMTFDLALQVGARWVVTIGATWLVVVVAAGALESATRGRVRALAVVGCPRAWRPVLLVVLGAALASATVVPATARPLPGAPGDQAEPRPSTPVLLPVPTRAVATRAPEPARVVVAPGDSLWSLSEGLLLPDRSDAEVLATVHELHRLNRHVVGDDPDLIHPGQRLLLPAPSRPGEQPGGTDHEEPRP